MEPTAKPTTSRRPRRVRKIALLVAAALLVPAACVQHYCRAFIRSGRAPLMVARGVHSRLAPGATLREALVLAYEGARREPPTAFGPAVAALWVRCGTPSGVGGADEKGLPPDARVWLLVPRGRDRQPESALPGTLLVGDPGGGMARDTEVTIRQLARCRQTELVFESGFSGWVFLPLTLAPDGRIASVGEIQTSAK